MKTARLTHAGKVLALRRNEPRPALPGESFVVQLASIEADGRLSVSDAQGRNFSADWLQSSGGCPPDLATGDSLLAVMPSGHDVPVVIGRIGPYRRAETPQQLILEASQEVSLRCGQSSLQLRSDGKVMIRGEDVLVRARGTQRIKAGTVNIN